ncbi:unnamed protein product [Larinioides sclopetarius]|uniref:Uncharacterized protein n=1 Tax=Larinioides sclopetarius TaxID=280406 RepID=A0AAV2A2E3_9ARAC
MKLVDKKIKNFIFNLRQDKRKNNDEARFTLGLLPKVNIKNCFGDFYLNQLLTAVFH